MNKTMTAALAILSVSTLAFIYLSNPLVWALIPLYAFLIGFYAYQEWKTNQELFRKQFIETTAVDLEALKKKVKDLDTIVEMSRVRR